MSCLRNAAEPARCARVSSLLTVSFVVLSACTNQASAQEAYRTDAFCIPTPGVQQTTTNVPGIKTAQACIDKCKTSTSLCRFATFWPKTKLCVISSLCDNTRPVQGSTVYPVQQTPQGTWTEWSFQPCTKTCGNGARVGTRKCVGTGSCSGKSVTAEACNTSPCRPAASWSAWSFQSCSKTCGGGSRTGTRTCSQARACAGSSTMSEKCNTAPCPASWSAWSFQQCSATCGGGTRTGTRTCQGTGCSGSATTTENCNTAACPVDPGTCLSVGAYTDWSDWSPCCGGTRGRVRKCSVTYARTGITTPDTSVYFDSETCTAVGTEKCGKYRTFNPTGGALAETEFRVGVAANGELRIANIPAYILQLSSLYLHPYENCSPSFTGCAYGFANIAKADVTTFQDNFFWPFYPSGTVSYIKFATFDLTTMPTSTFQLHSMRTLYVTDICSASTTAMNWCSLSTNPNLSNIRIYTKDKTTFYDKVAVNSQCPTVAARITSSACT